MKKLLWVAVLPALLSCGKQTSLVSPASEIVGTWKTPCYQLHDSGSRKEELRFLNATSFEYISERCVTGHDHNIIDWVGSYVLGPGPVRSLDLVIDYMDVTYLDDPYDIKDANYRKLCGSTTWQLGKPTRCDFTKEAYRTLYHLVEVKDGKLYLGKETNQYDFTRPDKRPIEIRYDVPFSP